jgi:ComF family protein
LPAQCLLCAAPARTANLCDGCRTDLPLLPQAHCPICAEPTLGGEVCGACLAHPPQFDRVLAPAAYAYPLDRLIQSFKYAGSLAVAPMLAELMLPLIRTEPLPDLIVAMPLSTERLRERGFNQSLEIARLIGARLGIPVDTAACIRVRHGEAQSALPLKRRTDNVKGAFVCMADFDGRSVAVVDDVLTTGSTLSELARVLKQCGAARVIGWMAARTLAQSA